MIEEQLREQCPLIMRGESLFNTKKEAVQAQAEFFKTHQFIFKTLSENEARVLRLRFGIDDGVFLRQEQIGKIMNLSRQRIAQIEERAFEKLKMKPRVELLKQYTDETITNQAIESVVKDFKSLIRQDILQAIHGDHIQVLRDVDIKDMNIKFGIKGRESEELKDQLIKKGFTTCSDFIKYLQTFKSGHELTYSSHKAMIFAIAKLIDYGKIRITSQQILDDYLKHKASYNRRLNQEENNLLQQAMEQEKLRQEHLLDARNHPENVDINDLGFSNRTYNHLKEEDINTLADLIREKGRLANIEHLGLGCIKEIVIKLHKLGISLISKEAINKPRLIQQIITTPEDILVEDLNLSTRSTNHLKIAKLHTLADLVEFYNRYKGFHYIVQLGEKSEKEIINKLKSLGVIQTELSFNK